MRAKIENYFYASIRRISIQLVVRKVMTVILVTVQTIGSYSTSQSFSLRVYRSR